MIKDRFKAIYRVAEQKVTKLYHLDRDPLEKKNLIKRYPKKGEEFEREIKAWRIERSHEKSKLGFATTFVEMKDPARIEQLKTLGYLQ